MKVLSLFSGCGGMDIGFEGGFECLRASVDPQANPSWIAHDGEGYFVKLAKTGFETVFANDIRPDAKAAWESYMGSSHPEGTYRLASVVDLVKEEREGGGVFPTDVDVVTGGFPCQDFSVAGKRLGFESAKSHSGSVRDPMEPSVESRGQLYMWMRDVISICKPKVFVAENVKGLTNLGDAKQIIEHDFAEADGGGYTIVPAHVINARDYGVPQSRERVIFFGFRRDALSAEALEALISEQVPAEYDPYPPKTHGSGLAPYATCSDAFAGLLEPWESNDPAQAAYSRCRLLARGQGQNEVKLGSVSPTIRSEHHGNIEYRRLSAEHGGEHADELAAGLPERRLSVRECARLQTFPDSYPFIIPSRDGNIAVSASKAYQLIGNAVPPVLAYAVAQNLASKWERYFG